MRHRCHSAANIFYFCTGTKGLLSSRGEIIVDAGNGDKGSGKNKEEEDSPAIKPYL